MLKSVVAVVDGARWAGSSKQSGFPYALDVLLDPRRYGGARQSVSEWYGVPGVPAGVAGAPGAGDDAHA